MKKLYSFIFAVVFAASNMYAQHELVFVDAQGNQLEDGATIEMNKAEEDFFGEMQVALTGISILNTTEDDYAVCMNATVNVISSGSFNCCLGDKCLNASSPKTLNITNVALKAGATLPISNTEWLPAAQSYGTCSVTLQIGDAMSLDEGATLNVNFVYADPAAVKDVQSVLSNVVVARYATDGTQLAHAKKGINIVRYADGHCAKVVR